MMNKEKNFISLIIYVHNDQSYIKKFLQMIDENLSIHFEKFEIICVNDASNDNSISEISEYAAASNSVISVINMSYQQGLEASMNAGIDLAIGDFIYELDYIYIDYPIDLIIDAYKTALSGYDIVSAGPNKAHATSKLYYWFYNRVSGTQNKLRTETFRILSRRAVNRIQAMNKTVPYRKAIYANCGLKMKAIFYASHGKHIGGQDRRVRTALNSLILFTDVAYKVSVCFALLMAVGTAGIGLYSLWVYWGKVKPVEGWTTTMLFLSLCFFAIFSLLAIIIKYLSIILDMIFRKQNYLVDSITKYGK